MDRILQPIATPVSVANGGTGLSSYATGDLIYANVVDSLARLAIGTANTVMTSSGTAPQWSTSLVLAGTISSSNIAGTISGNGTIATGGFTLTVAATASISGTNTGDLTLAAIGSTPNANGASLSGQALTLQPADGTYGGIVTTGAQTFAGDKTFGTVIVTDGSLFTNIYPANVQMVRTGATSYWDIAGIGGDFRVRTSASSSLDTTALIISSAGQLSIIPTTASTSTTTGALVVAGGAGIAGDFYMGGTLNVGTNIYATGGILRLASRNVMFADASETTYYAGSSSMKFVKSDGSSIIAQFDLSVTAGDTRFLIYDVDNATLERVSVGAADSGGSGYKVLRIPN